MRNKFTYLRSLLFLIGTTTMAQTNINGKVTSEGEPLPFANVFISQLNKGAVTDGLGNFVIRNIPNGTYILSASFAGLSKVTKTITLSGIPQTVDFDLKEDNS